MIRPQVESITLQDHGLWERLRRRRVPLGFDLELTARCNLDCRHCFVNLPAADAAAAARELPAAAVLDLARQAVDLGAVWCTITGGEPLLRPDFAEIYLGLKRLGLLVSVYTNATLVRGEHAALFRRYPPRDIEVTVYGATEETYERITRRPGSFDRFRRGLGLLLNQGIKVRLKAMALRSNLDGMAEIARFCREHTKDFYRFDPLLHLRSDRDPARNAEILSERLSPAEIARAERSDPERFGAMERNCERLIEPRRGDFSLASCLECGERENCEDLEHLSRLFICGAGAASFFIAHNASFRLCASLCAPGMTYDLREGTLKEAWERFAPEIRSRRTGSEALLGACRSCPIVNLCFNCPATADLECDDPEALVPYFCAVAHARLTSLKHECTPGIGRGTDAASE